MSTRAIHSEDAAAAAELVQLVRGRPNDRIDPYPPSTEMEVLVDMGTRGKGAEHHPRIAIDGDHVVGYGAVDHSPEMRRAQLLGPVVHPAHRTKDHGRRLLGDLVDQARAARQKRLRGSVGARNRAGQALLKAVGFKQKERHTCLRMARPPTFPEFGLDGIRVERVESDHGDTSFEFTRKLVPRQPKQVRALLKTEEYAALLAYKGGRPVGCVEVDMRYGDTASVENVDAPPSLLHKGLGNVLLSEAVKVAFANERVRYLDLLMTGTDRARLEALLRHGFTLRHELVSFELRL